MSANAFTDREMKMKISYISSFVPKLTKDKIIMILQSCDYCLERAVARIEEEGAENVLQEWHTQKGGGATASSDRKSKKVKNKPENHEISQPLKNLSGDDSASLKAKNAKPAVQETKVSNNNNKKRSGDTEISRNKNREVPNRNSSTANNVIDVNDVNLDDLKSKLIASSQSIDIKQCQLKLNSDTINLKFSETFDIIKQCIHEREQCLQNIVNNRRQAVENKLIEVQKKANDLLIKCESSAVMNEQQEQELKANILNYLASCQINTDAMEFNFTVSGIENITMLIESLGAVQCKAPIERLCRENNTTNTIRVSSSQYKNGGNAIGSKGNVSQNNPESVMNPGQKMTNSKKHKTIRDTVSEALNEALGLESRQDNASNEPNTAATNNHQQNSKKAKGKQHVKPDNTGNSKNRGNRSNRQAASQTGRGRNAGSRVNKAKQRSEGSSKAVNHIQTSDDGADHDNNSRLGVENHQQLTTDNHREQKHAHQGIGMKVQSKNNTQTTEIDKTTDQTVNATLESHSNHTKPLHTETSSNDNLVNNIHNGNVHGETNNWHEDTNPVNNQPNDNLKYGATSFFKDHLQQSAEINQCSGASLPQRTQKTVGYTNGNGSLDNELDLDE